MPGELLATRRWLERGEGHKQKLPVSDGGGEEVRAGEEARAEAEAAAEAAQLEAGAKARSLEAEATKPQFAFAVSAVAGASLPGSNRLRFKIDLTASGFGICMCGRPKAAHVGRAMECPGEGADERTSAKTVPLDCGPTDSVR